jgi:hypothetical protein
MPARASPPIRDWTAPVAVALDLRTDSTGEKEDTGRGHGKVSPLGSRASLAEPQSFASKGTKRNDEFRMLEPARSAAWQSATVEERAPS